MCGSVATKLTTVKQSHKWNSDSVSKPKDCMSQSEFHFCEIF